MPLRNLLKAWSPCHLRSCRKLRQTTQSILLELFIVGCHANRGWGKNWGRAETLPVLTIYTVVVFRTDPLHVLRRSLIQTVFCGSSLWLLLKTSNTVVSNIYIYIYRVKEIWAKSSLPKANSTQCTWLVGSEWIVVQYFLKPFSCSLMSAG